MVLSDFLSLKLRERSSNRTDFDAIVAFSLLAILPAIPNKIKKPIRVKTTSASKAARKNLKKLLTFKILIW